MATSRVGKVFNPYKLFVGSFLPNCLLRYDGISSTAKLVWARLAQYAGESGTAYPAQSTLAAEVGLSRRQVCDVLKELEAKGFIVSRVTKDGGSKSYRFLRHEVFDSEPRRDTATPENSTATPCELHRHGVRTTPPGGVNSTAIEDIHEEDHEEVLEEKSADAPAVTSGASPFSSHPLGKAYMDVFWPGTTMPDRWKHRAWSAVKEIEAHPFYGTTFGSFDHEKLVRYFTDWRDNESKWWAGIQEGKTDIQRESFQFIAKSKPNGILPFLDAKLEVAA